MLDNLERRKTGLVKEYYSLLKVQTLELAPHFPSINELKNTAKVYEELLMESTLLESLEPNSIAFADMAKMDKIVSGFTVINLDGKEIVARVPESSGKNGKGQRYLVDSKGNLIKGVFVSADETKTEINAGWHYAIAKDDPQILSIGRDLIFDDLTDIALEAQRLDEAKALAGKYASLILREESL